MNTYEYSIPCSCGGFVEKLPNDVHIVINFILISILIIGLVNAHKVQQIQINRND